MMTPPTYREIVLAISHFAATVSRVMQWGAVRITIEIECDESDAARLFSLMRKGETPERMMDFMGVKVLWKPKP